MHFDWTISIGTVIEALAIAGATWSAIARLYSLFDKRLSVFESVLSTHAATLAGHATRMEKQDDVMLKLSGDLQRVIGRIETWSEFRPHSGSC